MAVKIKYIGHSGFLIESGDHSIVIDPFINNNPNAAVSVSSINVQDIFVTHAHMDHLGDSVAISKNTGATITAIFELANYCAKKGAEAQGVNIGGKLPFRWGHAVFLPARHSSSTADEHYGGEAASILINIDKISIYHAGDTGLHYDLKMIGEFYKPDIAILPIGGFYTMGIDEAVQAANWLGSKTIIPMHYNTFPPIQTNVEEFKKKIESNTLLPPSAGQAKCIILKPGSTYTV